MSKFKLTLAGIHGRPFQPFNNVQATSPDNSKAGYCTHASILFPPWHRPYLALYEQVLHEIMQHIASWYPESVKGKYVAAASNFRIPYWDWAAPAPSGQSVLPLSVQSPTVEVDGPSGKQLIGNPLFSYAFQPLDSNALPDPPVSLQLLT